jgi:hypothetical protein
MDPSVAQKKDAAYTPGASRESASIMNGVNTYSDGMMTETGLTVFLSGHGMPNR